MKSLTVPVSLLQFWAFLAISLVFFAFLIRAAFRRTPEAGGKREPGARLGIILQSVGIACAGFGPTRPTLPNLSLAGLAGTLLVALLMSGAVYLFATGSSALGANWSIQARTRADHQLIRTGPYAHVRHPIYLGMLLFLLGLAAAVGHWLQLIVAIPLFLVGTSIRTKLEEKLLSAQFGQEYADYVRITPALIPRLG